MNKQEVLEELETTSTQFFHVATSTGVEANNKTLSTGVFAGLGIAKSVLTKLEEPQKVKVPEFVVEWFKENKHNLNFAIYELCEAGKVPVDLYEGLTDFERWFYLNHDIDTLIRMQDGYEVEEEPKYYVQLPFLEWNEEAAELEQTELYLGFDITSDETRFMTNKNGYRDFKTKLDEETIKSIDERYWQFAVPVEKV